MTADRDNPISSTPAKWSWQDSLLLAGILTLALALRLIKWDASLWFDEVLTAQRANLGIVDILKEYSYPIYYLLAHWANAFLPEETAVRAPSLIAGLAAIALMYGIGRVLGGRIVAVVGAMLLATSAFHIEHSQEARYYSGMVLLGLFTAVFLDKAAINGGPWRWFSYGAFVMLSLLSHLIFVLFAGAMAAGAGMSLLLSPRAGTRKARFRKLAALVLATAIPILLSFTLYMGQKHFLNRGNPQSAVQASSPNTGDTPSEPPSAEPVNTPKKARELHVLSPWVYAHYVWIYLFGKPGLFVVTLMGALSIAGLLRLFRRNGPLAWLALSILVFLPCILFIVPVPHFYQPRYFILVIPITYLLMAEGTGALAEWTARRLTKSKGKNEARNRALARWALAILVLGSMTPFTITALTKYYREAPGWQWKELVSNVLTGMKPGDVVACVRPASSAWGIDVPSEYYFRLLADTAGAPPVEPLKIATPDTLETLVREHPHATFWLIGGVYPGHLAPTPGSDYEPLFERLGAEFHEFQKAHLWVVPPAANNHGPGSEQEAPKP